MRLSQKDRAARLGAFRKMSMPDKVGYIFTYFKLPILLAVIALVLLGSAVYRQITKKEVVLYTAHINVAAGEDLESQLNEKYISASGADPRKAEVYLYRGLYLSDNPTQENHQYGYASKLKIMAAIESKQLDVVLMNHEAYNIFSHNGYLLELPDLLSEDTSLLRSLEPHLITNSVIVEDNAIEYDLNEADRYVAVTEESVNALDVSAFPVFAEAGFPEAVYLGVVANSPRQSAVLQYIKYLTLAEAGAQG